MEGYYLFIYDGSRTLNLFAYPKSFVEEGIGSNPQHCLCSHESMNYDFDLGDCLEYTKIFTKLFCVGILFIYILYIFFLNILNSNLKGITKI